MTSGVRLDRLSAAGGSSRAVSALLFALALICAFLAGALLFGGGASVVPPAGNDSAQLPGVHYAGVVGAQEAEVRGDYAGRTFESRLAAASTNESRGAVVAAEVADIEAQLSALEARKPGLQSAVENGTASRAETTTFVSRSLVLADRIDRVSEVAASLPTPIRERYGLTDAALSDLRDRAAALATPEMLATARQIGGDDVGEEFDDDDDDGDDSDDGDSDDDSDDDGDGDDADDDDSDGDDD